MEATMNSPSARTTAHTHRRPKVYGEGRPVPLDRNAKYRIQALARALSHPTETGKHYGILTDKFLGVLNALLWGFHNAATGRCFPSYDKIAERAHCCVATVYNAITALETAGVLTWVNRFVKVRDAWGVDLYGKPATTRWRVLRTSNWYTLLDPQKVPSKPPDPCESKLQGGTLNQVVISSAPLVEKRGLDPANPFDSALLRLGTAVRGAS
jgi:hypothetical protein